MQFLNPALLAGALLFAVPLIIHLLNRQRHHRRDWAAMEFLLRAFQKTRRRLRNENLLLLLLRCLIPVVLALAVARPVLRQAAALLGQTGGAHHVVVLDSSYSMGYQRDGGQSPFDRGRALVGRLLDRLAARTDRTDKVTLVTAGVRPRFVARADLNLALARTAWLDVTHPEDGAGDLTEAMVQVADALDSETEAADPLVVVYVLTDLQARAFGRALLEPAAAAAAGPEFHDTLRDALERLQKRQGTRVHLIDLGPLAGQRSGGVCDNVQISGLRVDQAVPVARRPLAIVATLRNRGASAATAQVTLEVDGGEPERKLVELQPGAEGEAEFQHTFREVGRRRLRASLLADGLEADDERLLAVDVRERIRVLVVDGAADDDPVRTYGYLYRGILGSGLEDSEFEVTTADTLALLSGAQQPVNYDVTVLADVDRLNEAAAGALRQALRAGKGLLCTFGDHTDAESFDLLLAGAGDGPMPFRLGTRGGNPAGSGVPRAPLIAMPEHLALREFDEDVHREILQAIPVYQWFRTAPDSLRQDAQVPLRLTDEDQSPLLVTAAFGDGRAAFLTSAPASEFQPARWNRFDDPIVAFQLLHGLVKWLALPAQDPFNVQVGAALTCSLPARPLDVEMLLPERAGGGKQPVTEEPRPLPGGRYGLPPFSATAMAGFYVCDLQLERDTGREPWSAPFAVRVDPDEGNLVYAAYEDVQQALGIERVETALPSEGAASADANESEFGPSLLLLALLLVVGESAMARYVSMRRH